MPEPNRSSVPYLVSVSIQCSLVLLLAIPWTVQKLINSGPIQLPTMLTFQNLKPMEPTHAARTNRDTGSSLPLLPRYSRIFVPSHSQSNGPVSVAAPEFEPGIGGASGIGLPFTSPSDLLTNLIPAPVAPATPEPRVDTPQRMAVGGDVQAAKLIHRVQPAYPALARQVRVQGVVVLDAIIAADGGIRQLRVLSGHPMLIPSAVEAVRQWVYSPTFLNGKPVEVKTTIEVRFTLSNR